MNAVLSSALARVASFIPAALATLATSRIVIEHYGVAAFDSYALMLSLIYLIPLGDLGVGSAVTNVFATRNSASSEIVRTVLTAVRVLAMSTIATAVAVVGLTATGSWPALLGSASGPNTWCGVALAIYALTLVPGLGSSILLGVHRNHLTVLTQSLLNPLITCLVVAAVLTGQGAAALVVAPSIALLLVNVFTSGLAARVTRLSWTAVLRALPNRKLNPGAPIRGLAGPVLIISIATPIALQSDRIVLSHVAGPHAVAEYSIAMQIFGPALVLIAATAQPLWPMYAQARARHERGPDVLRSVGMFGLGAGVLGALLAVMTRPVSALIGAGAVHISPLLAVSGGLFVLMSGLAYPVAMSLMDRTGIRVTMVCTSLALPMNIGLSVLLGRHLGAPGPLISSCFVGLIVQVLPGLVYSFGRQTEHRGRHRRPRWSSRPSTPAKSGTRHLPGMIPSERAYGTGDGPESRQARHEPRPRPTESEGWMVGGPVDRPFGMGGRPRPCPGVVVDLGAASSTTSRPQPTTRPVRRRS